MRTLHVCHFHSLINAAFLLKVAGLFYYEPQILPTSLIVQRTDMPQFQTHFPAHVLTKNYNGPCICDERLLCITKCRFGRGRGSNSPFLVGYACMGEPDAAASRSPPAKACSRFSPPLCNGATSVISKFCGSTEPNANISCSSSCPHKWRVFCCYVNMNPLCLPSKKTSLVSMP